MSRLLSVRSALVAAGVALSISSAASAQVTLGGSMTADNSFTAFISADPNTAGTAFLSGNNWPSTFSGSTVITTPGTYYLHVQATDAGRPEMFVADLTLSNFGPDFAATFANGTAALLTNTTDWRVSNTGFGQNYNAPIDLGANSGGATWSGRPGIAGAARFLWAPQYTSTVYFATTITVTQVPAPAAASMLGLAGLLVARRRRA